MISMTVLALCQFATRPVRRLVLTDRLGTNPEHRINPAIFGRRSNSPFAIARPGPISCPAGDLMKPILTLVFAVFTATAALAQSGEGVEFDGMIFSADEINLNELKWKKRPLVVFADTPNDPRFIEQMEYIEGRLSALEALDVIVITDTEPEAKTDIRRKPAPWHVREITRAIDKLPARQRELRESAAGDS